MRLCLALFLLVCSFTSVAELAKPKGPVILTVRGLISESNSGEDADFDLTMLQSLPQYTITTLHPWTESRRNYKGPRLSDLLKAVGARSEQLTLVALNDYQVDVDFEELTTFKPILAWSENDRVMKVRDKGPLWLMFPIDDHPELLQISYNDFMVWQLRSIIVK
ncbi:molybdopterin-binding oxidoreductase [Agarivorans sp.]|uniref:molybdopterin-binding oxidoreductase n=1 Tax=Agarivorans sp. TaxID=1872412 RepID=UPI003D05AA14